MQLRTIVAAILLVLFTGAPVVRLSAAAGKAGCAASCCKRKANANCCKRKHAHPPAGDALRIDGDMSCPSDCAATAPGRTFTGSAPDALSYGGAVLASRETVVPDRGARVHLTALLAERFQRPPPHS